MGVDPISIAGLALTAFGTVSSFMQQQKAAEAQKKALAVQSAMDQLKQQREARQAMREARIKRASIVQAGANQSATASSAVQGGAASVQSQLSGTLSFLDQMGQMAKQATGYQQAAVDAGASAGMFGAIANLGGTIFQSWKPAVNASTGTRPPVIRSSSGPLIFGTSSQNVL
jgi:hypothetical protein